MELDFAYAQVTSSGAPVLVTQNYAVKETGYAYVYVSNEQPTQTDVYFDDFKVTYTPTNILQYNEYYSHGAPNARSWTRDNTTTNNFLANGGTELNTTTALYDLEYRNYDPILGRMNGVDPMADKYGSLTPYNYSFNSPTMHNDVSGADPTDQTPYWIEESMQRNARRYKGEVIDTYNQFAGLMRTFGVSLSEQRIVGGYTGTGNNSPYLMPLGKALQTVHDAFDLTREQFIDKYAERVTGSIEYDRSSTQRYRVSFIDGAVTGITKLATAYMMNNMIASMKNYVANFGVVQGGGLTTINYGVYTRGGIGGLQIQLGYKDSGSGLTNFNYVQTIRTNVPLGGATSPYNDPQPPDDNLPFYWTNAELPSYTNQNGYNVIFSDQPTRLMQNGTTWQAELSVVGMDSTGNYVPITTITYGFSIINNSVVLSPITTVTPSAFHLSTF